MQKEANNIETNGLKRALQVDDEQTSVQIIYKLLSRKSKKKLEELLRQWSEWHAQQCSLSEDFDEDFESGDEIYFPALNVTPEKSFSISVYMDNQLNKKQKTEDSLFNKDPVPAPIYDRDFEFALTSSNTKSGVDILNTSRCFNCEAYDHSLKECPKPFNKVAVNKARKLHQLKSKRPVGPRVLTRYYQNTPGGKFDGLKPGCLDPETRKLLGIGEFDPPPWLNRMREMGYPPGYLDSEEEDQPSGIIIYTNEDTKEENDESLNSNTRNPKKKMSVDFPGINAPIPVNANKSRWNIPKLPTVLKSCSNNKINSPLNHIEESLPVLDYSGDPCSSYYMPGFPLLSKYANEYLVHMNQYSSQYSSFAYRNSWSSFHG